MREYELIKRLAGSFKRGANQSNTLFECDSEIIQIGDQTWALTMDDFSPEEDLFSSDNPVRLGNNLAVATLSDLLAAGAQPCHYMHTVGLPAEVDPAFLDGLMDGIRLALDSAGCFLCGGDVGNAEPWRYCGFAMGIVKGGKPLTHLIPSEPQALWVTGALGDANLAALQKVSTPLLELRRDEAEIIRNCATSCIDTSGGLFDALWLLHKQNPNAAFEIQMQAVPYAAQIKAAANAMAFPPEAALIGGAGEYELLFTVPERGPGTFENELERIEATRIGTVFPDAKSSVTFLTGASSNVSLTCPPPCPRDVGDIDLYVKEVMTMAGQLFGGSPRE